MSILDLLDKLTLQPVATTVALVLSVVTFWRQEVGKRAAAITVTFERVPAPKGSGDSFVVIHNAGPAMARDATAKFRADMESTDPIERGRVLGEPGTIPPGHAVRRRFVRALGTNSEALEVCWRDRRRGQQTLVVPVNIVDVPGTPVVNVNVEVPPPGGGRPATRRPGGFY